MVSESLFQQYQDLKKESSDCVCLMQVGAFMQVMEEDARVLSGLTGLKLKMGGTPEAPCVWGGFPKSGLDKYVGVLVRAGHSVAIAMQDEQKKRNINERIQLQ